ncbi:MAG: hypothetical protein GX636_06690 [Actinomycetales bacterium]|nr:hypothetical protein [Actinomycetales bacterium]
MTTPQESDRVDGELAEELAAKARHDHDDEIADEWGDESFPASDPPGH